MAIHWRWACAMGVLLAASQLAHANLSLLSDTNKEVLLYNRSRALLIGQSQFSAGWNALPQVPNDLAKLKDALTQQEFEVEVAENLAGRDILPTIQKFISKDTGPDTRLIIYISGHGWTTPGNAAATYLVGSDAPLPSQSAGPDVSRMLAFTALSDIYKLSSARHTLLVLDSCYSGALFQTKSAVAPTRLVIEQIRKPAFQMLASGQMDQRVAADGTFAELFIAGINGAAAKDEKQTFVTFRQLANWLFFELPKRSKQVPVYMDYPSPEGDMVFLPARSDLAGVIQSPSRIPVAALRQAGAEAAKAQQDTFRAQFAGTPVYYYRKSSDDVRVIGALNKLGVDYVARPPQLPDTLVTNALGCGPTTPVKALKMVARALIADGIAISSIRPYAQADVKGGRIEVLSVADRKDPVTGAFLQNLQPLTENQIEAISTCRTR